MVKKHSIVASHNIKRIKNIVRRAVSDYVSDIILLLARNFSFFVILSFLIALPVAWFIINNRIQDIVYRTSVIGWVVALSGFVILFIALIILNIKTIRSAIDNPVKSLRTE